MPSAAVHRSVPIPRSAGGTARELELSLMGAFGLSAGVIPLLLPGGAQRLLAFVALQDRPTTRSAVAAALWPDLPALQANASLRSAIWRLEKITSEAMQVDVIDLELGDGVAVDIQKSKALAHRLLIVDTEPSAADMSAAAIAALASDLLPDWHDDWAVLEAEDWQQLRLHALEALAKKLGDAGRFGEAVEAARFAIRSDPLRESSRSTLIRVHLAEGNQSEAITEFVAYRALLLAEMGISPSSTLMALVQHLFPEDPVP